MPGWASGLYMHDAHIHIYICLQMCTYTYMYIDVACVHYTYIACRGDFRINNWWKKRCSHHSKLRLVRVSVRAMAGYGWDCHWVWRGMGGRVRIPFSFSPGVGRCGRAVQGGVHTLGPAFGIGSRLGFRAVRLGAGFGILFKVQVGGSGLKDGRRVRIWVRI